MAISYALKISSNKANTKNIMFQYDHYHWDKNYENLLHTIIKIIFCFKLSDL